MQARSLYDLDTPGDRMERKVCSITESSVRVEEYANQLLDRLRVLEAQKKAEEGLL